jgi:hypothetical protein
MTPKSAATTIAAQLVLIGKLGLQNDLRLKMCGCEREWRRAGCGPLSSPCSAQPADINAARRTGDAMGRSQGALSCARAE